MRSVINILDLSTEEIDELIYTADDVMVNPRKYNKVCENKILATLFFEPSTRTRLSFESAMLSLGGSVLGFSEASSSSTAKGESLADTITVVSGYCDIIAMRHPNEGAPLVAADYTSVPIINAGDGGHYHPTQTLTDLLTIKHEMGRFDNLKIGLCGDLMYGRTVHSLISAMSRYSDIKFVLISPDELKLPDFIKQEYIIDKGIEFVESTSLEDVIGDLDILYMTRVQRERFESEKQYERLKDCYILTAEKMKLAKSNMRVMHPLPRVNEIATSVDKDSRACYFKQAHNGRYIRMALIMKMLGLLGDSLADNDFKENGEVINGFKCTNPRCITCVEQNIPSKFKLIDESNKIYRCIYCETEQK